MGSLTSRPKIPKAKKPVSYEPAPFAAVTPTEGSASLTTEPEQDSQQVAQSGEEEKASMGRSLGLLGRTRGRLSTVVTGFRGVLAANNNDTNRKTLLGE